MCVNPENGFNCYWQMPFRKKARITMENMDDKQISLFYQIDYTLTDVPDDAGYFHARFNRVHPMPYKEVYTIVDNIRGKGHYVGTYLAHGAYDEAWWGKERSSSIWMAILIFPPSAAPAKRINSADHIVINTILMKRGSGNMRNLTVHM